MADNLRTLLDALDDVLGAYRQRINDLELTVQNQQQIIEALRAQLPPKGGDEN